MVACASYLQCNNRFFLHNFKRPNRYGHKFGTATLTLQEAPTGWAQVGTATLTLQEAQSGWAQVGTATLTGAGQGATLNLDSLSSFVERTRYN